MTTQDSNNMHQKLDMAFYMNSNVPKLGIVTFKEKPTNPPPNLDRMTDTMWKVDYQTVEELEIMANDPNIIKIERMGYKKML